MLQTFVVVVKLASAPPPLLPHPSQHSLFVSPYLSSLFVEVFPIFAIRNYVCKRGVGRGVNVPRSPTEFP